MSQLRKFASICSTLFLSVASMPWAQADDTLPSVMQSELKRCFDGLKGKGEVPVYFMSYRVNDYHGVDLTASNGTLDVDRLPRVSRAFHVEVRVGSPKFDNTHNSTDCSCEDGSIAFYNDPLAPSENNALSIRHALWQLTEKAYRKAQDDYSREHTSNLVDVQNQDTSSDFSIQPKHEFTEPPRPVTIDAKKWQNLLRGWSAEFIKYPDILHSSVTLRAEQQRVFYTSTEGTHIERNDPYYAVAIMASSKLKDGMDVWLYDNKQSHDLDSLNSSEIKERIAKLAKQLELLGQAKVAEPYSGPAILRGKAAAVFFHEVFGHRAEGHRQKDEADGQTFTKKLGTKIMPSFISILDDPTIEKYKGVSLSGTYKYDDEGVPAQKVTLVDHGVLKNFLMSRSPIKGFPASNGHGRCDESFRPVARQANLLIVADKKTEVPFAQLRRQLIEQARKQKKAYGLLFDEIAGGSTFTQASEKATFSMQPLTVWRVYVDGRPDELIRGADIVGTPLASLENIIAASTDVETFNGVCGAESGWIPVSASSPSLLLRTIEIQKTAKSITKPPALPAPTPPVTTEKAAFKP